MKKLYIFKINWKRVSFGVLISFLILFLGGLIYCYFVVYRPQQEAVKVYNQLLEVEKQFYEEKGLLLPKD